MKPIVPPEDISDSDFVALTLRQLALMVDPRLGRISALAEELQLEPATLHLWIKNGRIPPKPCRRLFKAYGRKWVNIKRLTGDA